MNRIEATPAMIEDSLLPFSFPAVGRKKIIAAFDGGRITSADKLAAVIADTRLQKSPSLEKS